MKNKKKKENCIVKITIKITRADEYDKNKKQKKKLTNQRKQTFLLLK
jgi:hypothetical protein